MRDALFAGKADVALLHAEFEVGDGDGVRHHADIFVVAVGVAEQFRKLARAARDSVDELDGHHQVGVVQAFATVLENVFLDQVLDDLHPQKLCQTVYFILYVLHFCITLFLCQKSTC